MPNEAPRHNPVPLLYKHDPDLPIFARRQEILEALERHQVLIVAGDTGSGKSTQLPKYCLELGRGPGRGRGGVIAHTQPRRLAARALGGAHCRGTRGARGPHRRLSRAVRRPSVDGDAAGADDRRAIARGAQFGSGLATLRHADRGRGARALAQRRSAARGHQAHLAAPAGSQSHRHLGDASGRARLALLRRCAYFTVSGRGHPIEVRYAAPRPKMPTIPTCRPRCSSAYLDIATTPGPIGSGDVLVFLPGEREIRDVAELLERELPGRCAHAVSRVCLGNSRARFSSAARAADRARRPTSRRPRLRCRASAR